MCIRDSGSLDIGMLPVPNATTVLMKNSDVRVALSLTDEWEAVSNGSILTQGCIAFRSDLLDEAAIKAFLEEYEASVHLSLIHICTDILQPLFSGSSFMVMPTFTPSICPGIEAISSSALSSSPLFSSISRVT